MKKVFFTGAILMCVAASGCSTQYEEPIVYPRSYGSSYSGSYPRDYRGRYDPGYDSSRERSSEMQAAIDDCEAMAEDYDTNRNRYVGAAKRGVIGGAVGAGTGALAGTIMGDNVGRSTGAGAAVGGVLGVLSELAGKGDSNPSRRSFIEQCLERKGYDVAGWRSR